MDAIRQTGFKPLQADYLFVDDSSGWEGKMFVV